LNLSPTSLREGFLVNPFPGERRIPSRESAGRAVDSRKMASLESLAVKLGCSGSLCGVARDGAVFTPSCDPFRSILAEDNSLEDGWRIHGGVVWRLTCA